MLYSTEGQTQQPILISLLLVCFGFYFLIPGVKQSLLKVKWKSSAAPVDTFTYTTDVSMFLTLPFQPDIEYREARDGRWSISLATYQPTM